MNHQSKIRALLIILLLVIVQSTSYAQTEKQIVPADLKQQTLVTEPATLRKGFLRAGVLLNYRVADRFFNETGAKEYYISSTWNSKASYNLTLQYGLTDRLQLDLSAEYLNIRKESQSTDNVSLTTTSTEISSEQKGLGLGDTHFSVNYQIIPETRYKVSMTGKLQLTIPTGEKNPTDVISVNEYDLPVGDGTFALSTGLMVRSIVYPYSFTGYIHYTYNFKGTKIIDLTDAKETDFRFGNLIEAGMSANLHLNEWIVMANEFNFYHEGKGRINDLLSSRLPSSWAASYQPNLIFQVKRFRLGESVKIPLKGRNVPADPLYVVMIQYVF